MNVRVTTGWYSADGPNAPPPRRFLLIHLTPQLIAAATMRGEAPTEVMGITRVLKPDDETGDVAARDLLIALVVDGVEA